MLDKININIKNSIGLYHLFSRYSAGSFYFTANDNWRQPYLYCWLPISVMFSVIFIFGRYAIAPLILAFAITNSFLIKLTLPQAFILLFVNCSPCLSPALFCDCWWGSAGAAVQRQNIWGADLLGRLLRAGAPENHHVSRRTIFCVSISYYQLLW